MSVDTQLDQRKALDQLDQTVLSVFEKHLLASVLNYVVFQLDFMRGHVNEDRIDMADYLLGNVRNFVVDSSFAYQIVFPGIHDVLFGLRTLFTPLVGLYQVDQYLLVLGDVRHQVSTLIEFHAVPVSL